jgi:HPt (histidine-containing phosphotransfer) domain-containing protein
MAGVSGARRRRAGASDPEARLQETVSHIGARARQTNRARAAVIAAALDAWQRGSLGEEERTAAQRAAHQLAGSAGTFGYPGASAPARDLERMFATPPVGDGPSSAGSALTAARRRFAELDRVLAGDPEE